MAPNLPEHTRTMENYLKVVDLALGDEVRHVEFPNIRLRVVSAYSSVTDARALASPAVRLNAVVHIGCEAYEIESKPVRYLRTERIRTV